MCKIIMIKTLNSRAAVRFSLSPSARVCINLSNQEIASSLSRVPMERSGKGLGGRIAIICNAPLLLCKVCEHLNAVNILFIIELLVNLQLKLVLSSILHLLC